MNTPKKILFLADCLVTQKAGIHFFARQFIERCINQYTENQYFILLPYPYDELNAEEIIVPIKKYIPYHFRLRSFFDIPRAVKKLSPDVVIEMAHFGPFYIPESCLRVTVIHDLTPILFPEWHDKMSTLMHKILLPYILKNAEFIVSNSQKTRSDIIEYQEDTRDKIIVSYPSILSDTKEEKIYKNTILKNEKYLLTVGTIEPRKNYITLLRAFDKFCTRNKEIKLRIVGYKGWKAKPFFQLLKQSSFQDRIIVEGYTSKERLISLYNHATAFIFPSLYEGFGLPLLEAMSHNLPIICSDIPTSREVCADAALYFEKTNVDALVTQLILLLEDDALYQEKQIEIEVRYLAFNQQKLHLSQIL